MNINKRHAIDRILSDIKRELYVNFTKKWSKHSHPNDETCNSALVIDGLWKYIFVYKAFLLKTSEL